jgi:hypothetical protein
MLTWLKSLFGAPQPAGPPRTIRKFQIGDPTLTRVSIAQDAWSIDSGGNETIRLFEIENPDVEQCLLTYRAKMKADGLSGRAYLEMWCRFPGRGEFFSKGVNQPVSGTTEWTSSEIPFFLKKSERPDLIKLNVAVEGKGRVLVKDVELLATPLR